MTIYRYLLLLTLVFFYFFSLPLYAFSPKSKKVSSSTTKEDSVYYVSETLDSDNIIDPNTVLSGTIVPKKFFQGNSYTIEIELFRHEGRGIKSTGDTLFIEKNISFPYRFMFTYDKERIKKQPRLYGIEARVYENGRLKWRNVDLVDPFEKNPWRLEIGVQSPFVYN